MSSAAQPVFSPYRGPRTSGWAQAWVMPRYAYREVMRSKMTLVLLVTGCVMPVLAMLAIYARQRAEVLAIFGADFVRQLVLENDFFIGFLVFQAWIALYLAIWIGPPLIARDFRNNALPLYLARPLTRRAYVSGKLVVLLGPLSLITWVAGLLIVAFEVAFEGLAWLDAHARVVTALVLGSWVLILLLALTVLAVSVVVQRQWVARGALLGAVLVLRGVGGVINGVFETTWGDLIAPTRVITAIWSQLFGPAAWFEMFSGRSQLPAWSAWAVVTLVCVACVVVLARRIHAYEVVR